MTCPNLAAAGNPDPAAETGRTDARKPVRRVRPGCPGRPRTKNPGPGDSGDGMTFLGVRIPKDVHQRLYRAKASLEFSTGKFYGMGRLIERVLKRGLEQIERSLPDEDPVAVAESAEESGNGL